ncbi:MAG: hypothetical protein IPM24_25195 [Bryobacterales bacterium]|nr:hypothetical protein [Bryobacterales bacterium]
MDVSISPPHGGKRHRETVDFESKSKCWSTARLPGQRLASPLNLAATNLAAERLPLGHESTATGCSSTWTRGRHITRFKRRQHPGNLSVSTASRGEYGGKWYKGTYGWNFTIWSPEYQQIAHRNTFDAGSWPGFSNAFLLTGDPAYIAVLRRQMDNIQHRRKWWTAKRWCRRCMASTTGGSIGITGRRA